MKSKDQEIQILRSAITELGANTYLGPWLAAIVDEVAGDLRNDVFPCRTLRDTQAECALQTEATARLCREHKEQVRKECDQLLDAARATARAIMAHSADQLRAALRELGH